MATHDIPREAWQSYFREFTQKHHGALVRVETVDSAADPRINNAPRTLVEIGFDPEADQTGVIMIKIAAESHQILTHEIASPKHVYHKTGAGILSDEVNTHEVLEITASSHPAITHLQFRPKP